MTLKEAKAAERAGRIVEAADLYEDAVSCGEADLSDLLNLTILYWESTSMGFYSYHRLSDDFVDRANARYRELLELVAHAHADAGSVKFWTRYIAAIEDGRAFTREDCISLRRAHPEYLEPEILIVEDGKPTSEARELLEYCKREGTVRAAYVTAVLEATFARRGRG